MTTAQPSVAPIETVPVTLGCSVTPGPDGQPWIMYEWSLGLTKMAMLVPVATARQLPQLVQDMTAQALTHVPAGSGLLLPPGVGGGVLVPRLG